MKSLLSIIILLCSVIFAQEIEVITINGYALNMIKIPAGSFMMGESNTQNQMPIHKITFSNDFLISQTEISRELYKQIMGSDPSTFSNITSSNNSNSYPVDNVSWVDADNFCQKISTSSGRNFSLPTEAQWEFVCRAGTKTRFYCGELLLTNTAWFKANSSNIPAPIKSLLPNPWGVYDMSGNLWEWCSDWYDEKYYSHSPTLNPLGPSLNTNTNPNKLKVARGGSFNNDLKGLTSAYRGNNMMTFRSPYIGFRVVISQ